MKIRLIDFAFVVLWWKELVVVDGGEFDVTLNRSISEMASAFASALKC